MGELYRPFKPPVNENTGCDHATNGKPNLVILRPIVKQSVLFYDSIEKIIRAEGIAFEFGVL